MFKTQGLLLFKKSFQRLKQINKRIANERVWAYKYTRAEEGEKSS